jgi:hypothetical protein
MGDVSLDQRLASLEDLLGMFRTALDGQTDILRTQTEMLAALWRELTREPGPSPAVQAIDHLTTLIITRLDAIAATVQSAAERQVVLAD